MTEDRSNYVDGEWTAAESSETLEVVNPANTGEVVATYPHSHGRTPKRPWPRRRTRPTTGRRRRAPTGARSSGTRPDTWRRAATSWSNSSPARRGRRRPRRSPRSSAPSASSITTPRRRSTTAAMSKAPAARTATSPPGKNRWVSRDWPRLGTTPLPSRPGRWRPRSPPATRSSSSPPASRRGPCTR